MNVKMSPEDSSLRGWGGGIRTPECRYQKPVPYHLATPHHRPALTDHYPGLVSKGTFAPKTGALARSAPPDFCILAAELQI